MRCPICGKEMDASEVPSYYQWNKGLPKTLVRKDWKYYTCNNCDNKNLLCFFVFFKRKIWTWDASDSRWKELNQVLNPSRRNQDLSK